MTRRIDRRAQLPDGVPVGLFRTTPEGSLLAVNEALVELLGYADRDALLKAPAAFYADPDEPLRLRALLAQDPVLRNYETRVRRRDGRVVPVELSLRALAGAHGNVFYEGAVIDVTERKLAEESLWDSERRLRLFLARAPAVLWATDREMRFTLSMGAGLDAVNLRQNQVVGMPLTELLGTDDPSHPSLAAHRRCLRGEPQTFEVDFGGRVFRCYAEPWREGDGAISGVIGVALDVTESRRADDALKRTVSLLESTLESTADGVVVVDLAGRVVSFNRRFTQLMGLTAEQVAGADYLALARSTAALLDEPEAFIQRVQELHAQPEREAVEVLRFRDGRVFECHSIPQRLEGRPVGRVCSFRDVAGAHGPKS